MIFLAAGSACNESANGLKEVGELKFVVEVEQRRGKKSAVRLGLKTSTKQNNVHSAVRLRLGTWTEGVGE